MTLNFKNQQGCYIIAEAGVNHNGDIALAKELVDVAVEAKADAVKFQTFVAESLISVGAKQADYQQKNTGISESQLDMVKRLELTNDEFKELHAYCVDKPIDFLSTGFDPASMKILVDECHQPLIKIPSGELTNSHMLIEYASYQLPMILSTGMANMDEIKQALALLSYGFVHQAGPSSLDEAMLFYATPQGQKVLEGNIALLQCVTEYPAPVEATNLRAMQTMHQHFGCPVGLSDHSLGIHIPVGAVALGATIIEKHFTLDQLMEGPDHKASLNPEQLNDMVAHIRDMEAALGDGVKQAQPCEVGNAAIARRSLVAAQNIKQGALLTSDNLCAKRPGDGISALHYWDYLGQNADKNVHEDELL